MDNQILENFNVTTTTVNNVPTHITNERINAPSVLRGIEGGALHFITVPTCRDQEFIDHSLLNPEYITTHIPSGFIIDFMNNQDNSNNEQHPSSVGTVTAAATAATTPETAHFITESAVENVNIVHQHHNHHQQPSIHHHHQQQQQQHIEFHEQPNDEHNRKLTAAFFQLVNDKQYPVKITTNEAQVIVTNKDVLQQLEETSKQHHHQQQQQNSVLVAQNLLTAATTTIDDGQHSQQQQQQQTITQTFLHDNQFRIYEPATQVHINSTLPPLTPISRLTRSRKGTNSMSIQNTQTKINSSYGVSNNNFNKNTDDTLVNDEVEMKSLVSQQQQQRPLAKKNLPHKKRITKKLKIIDKVTDLQQQQQQMQQQQQPVQQQQQLQTVRIAAISSAIQTDNVQVFEEESNAITMPQFTCQLCGVGSDSQLDFFSHLKEHYEPESFKKISSPKKQEIIITNEFSGVSTDIRFDESFIQDNINNHQNDDQKPEEHSEMNITTTNGSQIHDKINVTAVEIIHPNQNQNELHIHNHTINDQNDLNDHNQNDSNSENHNSSISSTTPPKDDDLQGPEVEFSDTEDMLEGIRGVVDKVQESVDNDSNDCINLINGRWYSNSALNGNVTNSNLEEPQVDNFSLFNRSDIEKLIEQQEQINLDNAQEVITEEADIDNTSVHDIELPSANELEMSMDSVEIPPQPSPSPSLRNMNTTENEQYQQRTPRKRRQTKTEKEKRTKRGRKPKGKSNTRNSRNANAENEINYEDDDDDEIYEEYDDDDDDDDDNNKDFKFKTKKRLQCTKCDKLFNSANALKYHDLSHTGERPHQCEVCGKSFFAQSALKVHMRLHSGDKPYICEFCNRPFRQWGDLKYHTISIHTNMKSFQCEFCGKAFARRYSLVVHRRIHTCEKNYKCEFCPKSFRASSYLQNHRKIHTGEKPYMCKFCGKKFRVCGDLRRHENIHTRDKRKSNKTSTKKDETQKRNSTKSNKTGKKLPETQVQSEVKIEMTSIDSHDIEKSESRLSSNSNQNQTTESNNISDSFDDSRTIINSIPSSSTSTIVEIIPVAAISTDSNNIDVFKTEPNFESSSSTEMTLNNVKIESLSSSTITLPISNLNHHQQEQQLPQNIFVSIPKRQIIKDPINNSSNRIIKNLNDDENTLDTTTQLNINKERFVYFW